MSDEIETPETSGEADVNDTLKAALDKALDENTALEGTGAALCRRGREHQAPRRARSQ